MDGDSWTWRTNCPPQTGKRSCKLRRKNIWKPTDSKLQVKMGKLEKELEVLATASVQSQDVCVCVTSHRVSWPASQQQKQPRGSTSFTPESHGLFDGLNRTTRGHSRNESTHCLLSSAVLQHRQPFSRAECRCWEPMTQPTH